MPSAMSRPLTMMCATLVFCLVAPAFSQPNAKHAKTMVRQKPAATVTHPAVSFVQVAPAANTRPIVAKTAVRVSVAASQTFTPMEAWALANRPGENCVRQSMAPNSPVIERLRRGTQFIVIGRGTDRQGHVYYEVEAPNAMVGWMDAASVRFM
ncbi:MAG TPA: SH3 domain-containing protein [Capsulimonadaceae bacterium]|nr:SH3 domain-containing protein [Capsulimonadaceae bacterium]